MATESDATVPADDLPADGTGAQGVGLSRRRLDDLPGLQGQDGDVLSGQSGADGAPPDPFDDGVFPEIGESVLARSVALRFPDLEQLPETDRPEKLEFFIAAGARMRGELADLRLRASFALKGAEAEWDLMTGWELNRREKTKAGENAAKARTKPVLWKFIQDGRWVVERCTEEMKRHDADFDAASRAYTILSGG